MKLNNNLHRDSSLQYLVIAIVAIAVITLFPFVYYQQDVTLRIHDNMDSNIVWVKMLLENNACWVAPDTIVEQVMNGVPRSSLSSTYDLALLIFWMFGIFWGYAINKVIIGNYRACWYVFIAEKAYFTFQNT